jgi:hypothetical protein
MDFFFNTATELLKLLGSDDNSIIDYLRVQLDQMKSSYVSAQGSRQKVRGYYRVTVSAHGLDEQSFEPPLKNVQATFMFQQPGHSFSAFACSRPISGPGSPTYCDFRTRVFRCMSHIIFSSPASYDPSMLKYFQQGIFQSIYSKELAAQRKIEPVTPDPTRFGPKSSSFGLFDYTLNHEKTQIHRKYDLTPTSVSPTVKNQLEYANSNGTEVWLVPGISVSAELIDMCVKGKNGDFVLEVLMITSRYGVFVDVYIPGTEPMYGIDIFDLLKQLSLNGSQFKQLNQKKTDSADYEKYASRNDAKTAGKLAKHLAAYIPDLDHHHHHETSSGLLNSVLSQLEAGRSINTTNIKSKMTIEEFLSNYDGNLYPKLDEYQISQILSLDAAIVLNDGGYVQIHDIVKDEDTATKLLKFIRKVFIIYEFSNFITTSTSLSITSDEIIAILAKYHKQKTMSTDHHISIEFLDQTCRDCGINKCTHVARRGGTRRKKQKTKKTNKGRKVRNVKRGKKPQFRTTRKRKYRIKNNYTYK